jgi:hypothetical protein
MELRPEILLHPNVPKPLHGLNPRSLLGQEWWDRERRKAYAANNYCCWACGVHKSEAKYHQWLEAHECYQYNYTTGTATMIEVVALCHSCHNFIHRGKLSMDLQAGRITEEKYDDILEHGEQVLKRVCTIINNPYIIDDGGCAEWSQWKLILEGKEYYSRFKNFEEWRKYYSKR